MRKIVSLLGMAVLGGAITLGGYKMLFNNEIVVERTIAQPVKPISVNYAPTLPKLNTITNSIDFSTAAEKTVNSVVHVKNITVGSQVRPMDIFFGNSIGFLSFRALVLH